MSKTVDVEAVDVENVLSWEHEWLTDWVFWVTINIPTTNCLSSLMWLYCLFLLSPNCKCRQDLWEWLPFSQFYLHCTAISVSLNQIRLNYGQVDLLKLIIFTQYIVWYSLQLSSHEQMKWVKRNLFSIYLDNKVNFYTIDSQANQPHSFYFVHHCHWNLSWL